MQKTVGLGRGLSSLLPGKKIDSVRFDGGTDHAAEPVVGQERIMAVPVEKITPNPHQPRRSFETEDLQELAASIKENGIIQPLILTPIAPDAWQLIAGERRWRAAKSLGLATVPAIVREFDEQKKMEIALIENLLRKNLNALETAEAYKKLLEEFSLTQEQLSQRLGKSRPAITNTLRVLTAIDEVKEAIKKGQISEGHARVLAGLPASDQQEVLRRILNDTMSVRETEKAGREVVIRKHLRKVFFDPEVKAREEALQRCLGTKVDIKKTGGAGQIIIKFFSDEEFNEICRKLS